MIFFKKIKQIILKCLWNHNRPQIAKASWERTNLEASCSWFQITWQSYSNQNSMFQQKTDTDQCSRIENPEINPCIHAHLIYNKWGKNMKCGKNSLFNKLSWENWTVVCKKMKLNNCLTSYTKINSKWIKSLKCKIWYHKTPNGKYRQ